MVGEHIRALKGGHWNHAIDCGDETVIHLADGEAEPSRVRRSYRPEFVSGAEAVEVVTHRERTFPASEVVARAYSRIADPGLSAMFRDSEAFAEWCVTGRLPAAVRNVAVAVPGRAPAAPPPATPAVVARATTPGNGVPGRTARKPTAAGSARKTSAKVKAKARAKTRPAVKSARTTKARKKAAKKTARRGGRSPKR